MVSDPHLHFAWLPMFGFLNCNKPIGFTSRDLVNVVQGRLRGRKIKVGHCGTLDPLADGVLVIGVGAAAKLVPYVHELSKTYHGSFRLAAETATGDLEFEPTVHFDHPVPTLAEVQSACCALTGVIRQTPPAYSAIRVDGKRAYSLVRQGQSVEMPSRMVQIDSIDVLSYAYPDLKLEITCGTGTYIRTLGMDLAKSLKTVAVMTSLTRTRIGEFGIEKSASLDQLRNETLDALLVPATVGISHLPKICVSVEQCVRLIHGLGLDGAAPEPIDPVCGSLRHAAAITDDGHLQAILVQKQGIWCPKRVFPRG